MTLKDVIKQEKKIKKMLKEIKAEIKQKAKNIELEGVIKICDNPNIVTVKLSDLKNNNWSPDYYSAETQANHIITFLENTTTATSFIEKIQKIIQNKEVVISHHKYSVRDEIIDVLKKYI